MVPMWYDKEDWYNLFIGYERWEVQCAINDCCLWGFCSDNGSRWRFIWAQIECFFCNYASAITLVHLDSFHCQFPTGNKVFCAEERGDLQCWHDKEFLLGSKSNIREVAANECSTHQILWFTSFHMGSKSSCCERDTVFSFRNSGFQVGKLLLLGRECDMEM